MGGGLFAQDSGGPLTQPTLRLASKSIRHAQVFESDQIVVTEGTSIDEQVKVKFHACDKIVFEEGFKLAPGAEMTATVEENCKHGREFQEMRTAKPTVSIGPNPFADQTYLNLDLPTSVSVQVQIYDLEGRMVAEPLSGAKWEVGSHRVQLNLSNLPSGSYFYRLKAGEILQTGKLIRVE